MQAPGWEGILDEGERILWQGRPDTRLRLKPAGLVGMAFGVSFAGFALFWMIMAAQAGGGFWMFGLLHFAIGLALALGPLIWDPFRRSRTWYTLTDRRAFIATDLPLQGKRLKSYPIDEDTLLEFTPGEPATVSFAQETRRGNNGRRHTVRIGFERIPDGERVYRLIRDIQRRHRRTEEG